MKIPWAKIKAEWLKGGITHEELAKKYNVKVKTIQNRSFNEGWGKQKGKIREKTEDELSTRIAHARANKLAKLITAQDDLMDGLMELMAMVKEKPQLFFSEKGDLRNAESLTRALQTATLTQRDLHGMKNIDQKFNQKKWREQQALERELKAQKEVTEQTGQMVVYIHQPAEEEQEAGTGE